MLRLFSLYKVASAPAAVILLLASNLLPLIGVLLWGWNLWSIVILYWIENGIVGALNVPKMLLAQGGDASGRSGLGGRILMAGFFAFHYGVFWLVQGVFVWLVLPLFAGFQLAALGESELGTGAPFGLDGSLAFSGVRGEVLQWGAIALLISHAASFVLNYVGRGEYLTRSVSDQMSAPYARVVILQLTILLGAFAAALIGQPIGALVVLVGLKTVLDLWLHLREHLQARSR